MLWRPDPAPCGLVGARTDPVHQSAGDSAEHR